MTKELLEEIQGKVMARAFHNELEKIGQVKEAYGTPDYTKMKYYPHKADLLKAMAQQGTMKKVPGALGPALSKATAAPSVKKGLGQYIKHLARKTTKQLGKLPIRGLRRLRG